jgi:hypothetical protein
MIVVFIVLIVVVVLIVLVIMRLVTSSALIGTLVTIGIGHKPVSIESHPPAEHRRAAFRIAPQRVWPPDPHETCPGISKPPVCYLGERALELEVIPILPWAASAVLALSEEHGLSVPTARPEPYPANRSTLPIGCNPLDAGAGSGIVDVAGSHKVRLRLAGPVISVISVVPVIPDTPVSIVTSAILTCRLWHAIKIIDATGQLFSACLRVRSVHFAYLQYKSKCPKVQVYSVSGPNLILPAA